MYRIKKVWSCKYSVSKHIIQQYIAYIFDLCILLQMSVLAVKIE